MLRPVSLLIIFGAMLVGCADPNEAPVPEPCPPVEPFPPASDEPRLAASPGPDRQVEVGQKVVLDGSGSVHLDGKQLTYHWYQTAGPCVDLEGADQAKATFRVPNVHEEGDFLRFELVVEADGEYSEPNAVVLDVVRD